MTGIYDSIKSLITSTRIGKASEVLSETEPKLSAAAAVILPSLLGALIKEHKNPTVEEIVEDAGKVKLHNDYDGLFEGHGIVDGKNYGERMENALVGVQNEIFPNEVAKKAGIKKESADRLSNWISATIAAYFGEKVVGQKMSLATLMGDLEKEKTAIKKDIPSNIYSSLGLTAAMGAYETVSHKPAEPRKPAPAPVQPKQKKSNWLWWVIAILLILLVIWLICRSCSKEQPVATKPVTEQVQPAPAATTAPVAKNQKQHTLADGTVITMYEGSCEDCVIKFLNSDEYKNASADDLKKTWFEFDNIDFVHNSSTELMAGSMTQLDNLASILKNYPNAKIRIGGFADKTGTEQVNDKISKERAERIKQLFKEKGVAENRISTEGFGEEFATVAVNATDAERATDRDIAMRFVK
ncbi:OmpA family protein [uncultured Alistipes sp.]|jgi:ompA/motB family protein|uniref:OmpA family protein n=1 Tax=uncultured Alistipes sp. TaxID=538949 RepID=UPI0025EC88CE|nr:OmpA family protein [uncultured Alistipes sp.]